MIAEIAALAERCSLRPGSAESLKLRRANQVRTIQASLAIEGNTLSEEQVSEILDGKRVAAPLRQSQEVKNAIAVYDIAEKLNPFSVDDLLHYSLTLVNDAPEVAQYDDLPVPPWNGRTQTNITLKAPQNVRVIWTSATGIASVTWEAAQGAIQYEVQHSANGIDWIHDGLTSNTSMPIMNESKMNWSGNASSDTIFVRVAALNNTQKSEWTEWPE